MSKTLLKFSDTWHVPQDWPRRPGIVRHMEFCAKRIIQPMNTIKKNAPHLIEPDYMKTHKMMNQIRREYDQAWFNQILPLRMTSIDLI